MKFLNPPLPPPTLLLTRPQFPSFLSSGLIVMEEGGNTLLSFSLNLVFSPIKSFFSSRIKLKRKFRQFHCHLWQRKCSILLKYRQPNVNKPEEKIVFFRCEGHQTPSSEVRSVVLCCDTGWYFSIDWEDIRTAVIRVDSGHWHLLSSPLTKYCKYSGQTHSGLDRSYSSQFPPDITWVLQICSNQNWPISRINIRINRECKTSRKIILIPRLDRGHLPKVVCDTISCLSIKLSWLVSCSLLLLDYWLSPPLACRGREMFSFSLVVCYNRVNKLTRGSISQDEMFRNPCFQVPPPPPPPSSDCIV